MEPQTLFDDVVLAGQPRPCDLEEARRRGTTTVVNLRLPDEVTEFDEAALVTKLGMRYHNLGFGSAEELTDDLLTRARAILADPVRRPLLLHCASANRVGAIWLAYRVLDCGESYDDAREEATKVGLRSAAYEKRARDYTRARTSHSMRIEHVQGAIEVGRP